MRIVQIGVHSKDLSTLVSLTHITPAGMFFCIEHELAFALKVFMREMFI
jgi:hypothetical protein